MARYEAGYQLGFVTFSIAVFEHLKGLGGVMANDPAEPIGDVLGDGKFWVMECFPTSIWRTSGLKPLPGKSSYKKLPSDAQMLPPDSLAGGWFVPHALSVGLSHDNLQALVAALPAIAFTTGFGTAVPRGRPAFGAPPMEGLIWDASPPTKEGRLQQDVQRPATLASERLAEGDADALEERERQ